MQAAVVPAVNSSWQVKDVPQPQPGPNQVLVKMHASGICYTDVHQTLGHLPGPFPRILGHEPVGEIVAVAPNVTTQRVGARVGTAWIQSTCGRCEWCQRGRRMFCPYLKGTGIEAQGGHAEYMLMNADATYLIPGKVSYEQAAPIFCAGYTVYSGLRWADPQPHDRVAVLGIGGLWHLAVQYAKAAGFETIAVSHSPDKDKMIRDLGADEVVRDGKGLAAAGGADVILSRSEEHTTELQSQSNLVCRLLLEKKKTIVMTHMAGDIERPLDLARQQRPTPSHMLSSLRTSGDSVTHFFPAVFCVSTTSADSLCC